MWSVATIGTSPATLDLGASDQGSVAVTRLLFDGVVVANAVGFTEWTQSVFQVEVCESCGVEHCALGGWLTLRRIGEQAAFIPAFNEIAEDGWTERAPPAYVRQRGVPLLAAPVYAQVRALIPGLPEIHALPPITRGEAAHLFRFEAPAGIFEPDGHVRSPSESSIEASSDNDVESVIAAIHRLLALLDASPAPATVAALPSAWRKITLYLRGGRQWQPLVYTLGTTLLHLDPEFVIAEVEAEDRT